MILSLHLPRLPLQALLHREPELKNFPLAVIDPPANDRARAKSPVLACNRAARQAGLCAGMSANQALARCPDLLLRERVADSEKALASELEILARSLSPDLELTRPDTVLAEVFTLREVRQNPREWMASVLRRKNFPHALRLALAPTPDLADLAARQPGDEKFFLLEDPAQISHLPLAGLPFLPPALAETFTRWGLRETGDFTALDHAEILDRLGPEAGRLHQILTGRHNRLLKLNRPATNYRQTLELDDAVETLEALCFILKRLLGTLCNRLREAYRVASELHLTLHFERGEPHARSLRVAEPSADPLSLLAILHTALESTTGPSAISKVTLKLTATTASRSQRDLFKPELKDPTRFHQTLSQLEALVGRGQLGIPVLQDSHRPDSFELVPFQPDRPARVVPGPLCRPGLPLRRLRPPPPVRVVRENGRPAAILNGPYPGRVTALQGPTYFSGEWWETPWKRAEWDLQLHTGHLLRLTHQPPEWILEGVF